MPQPCLFIGHGSPMNAMENNTIASTWENIGRQLARPEAIIVFSAHWETDGTFVSAHPRPEMIYDFYGFPPALSQIQYPAPGHPELARKCARLCEAELDTDRGFDHGTWSVLCRMFPAADIPVLQISLDKNANPRHFLNLGRQLAPLRNDNVLILGSGNLVHHLGLIRFGSTEGYPWADRIRQTMTSKARARDFDALCDYQTLDPEISKAIPTPEHFLPLLPVLGASNDSDSLTFLNDFTHMGSLSMTCLAFGLN